MSKALSGVAVVLAVLALAASFGVFGPARPSGQTSPSPVVAQTTNIDAVRIGTGCTQYAGSEVSVTVPGPGTVVVTAMVRIRINNYQDELNQVWVLLATAATDCDTLSTHGTVFQVSSLQSPDVYYPTLTVLRAFSITLAGTYTYYLNGEMQFGGDAQDSFLSSSTVAVFYPS